MKPLLSCAVANISPTVCVASIIRWEKLGFLPNGGSISAAHGHAARQTSNRQTEDCVLSLTNQIPIGHSNARAETHRKLIGLKMGNLKDDADACPCASPSF